MSSCGVRLSVCLSRSWVAWKRIGPKGIFEIFSPSGSQAILVFHAKRDGDIPTEIPLTGASNAGGVGKKTPILNEYLASLHYCQPYESRSVKNKAATNGGERRDHRGVRRPLFAQDDDEVFVTGSTLHAGDGSQIPPDTTLLFITPFSAAVGQNPAGIFFENWH